VSQELLSIRLLKKAGSNCWKKWRSKIWEISEKNFSKKKWF